MIALLAVQLPLCCCEVRAAMASLAHASHAGQTAPVDDCCTKAGKNDCCKPASEAGDADDRRDTHAPAQGDCCITCKDRAAPAIASSIDLDSLHTFNFVASTVLATAAYDVDSGIRAAASAERDTGPPAAPGGRATLALHSTLVI